MSLPVPARAGLDNPLAGIQFPVRAELDLVSSRMWEIVADDNPLIGDVNRHLQGMQGKLLRPALLLLANAVEDTRSTVAIDHAAVIELVHLSSIVHDDSVDHSVLRRGMPTVNAVFSHQVSVIMGDYLYSRAVRHLVRSGDFDSLNVIANAANAMTRGELWQLSAVDRLQFSEEEYFQLNHAKTASLMSAACEVGAICGAPSHREALARFGERLGMAFQVADDILDYTETASVTGKPSGLDLKEHKVTLPLIAALPRLSRAGRATVDALFSTETPADHQIVEVIALVAHHGGIDDARRRGEQFALEAEAALDHLPDMQARAALADAILYVMDRRS